MIHVFASTQKLKWPNAAHLAQLAEHKTWTMNVKLCSKTLGVAVQPGFLLPYQELTEIQLLHTYLPPFPAHVLGFV